MERRAFLTRTAASAAAAMLGAGLSAAEDKPQGTVSPPVIPTDVTITKIEAAVLQGTRPRVVGRNARLGVHGTHARDPIARLHTDAGVTAWGWCGVKPEDARKLVGRKLHEAFDLRTGVNDAFTHLDFPLWDLAGRILGRPVYALLGGAGRHPVPVYDGAIYFDDLDPETGRDRGLAKLLEGVKAGLDAGFRAFKAKIGRGNKWMEKAAGFRRDVEAIQAIREMIGKDGKLMVDANNGYSPDEARELMRQAGGCDLHWFEEPFPEGAEPCLAFKKFLREGGWRTLIADGEGSNERMQELTEIVRAGGIDVVQFDLRSYKLTKWWRYLRRLEGTKALASPHNWGSHLSGYYIAQFGRGCPRFAMAEIDSMNMPAVSAKGYELREGAMHVPDTPGFGLELDPAALKSPVWTVDRG
ncbi:MAG TPA: enolase C-terminal domain-like protein [Planctomycetota bacterium]|nr:enolase C-terminal domain-like protein [Planctomycetota bacterium]